MNDQKQSPEDNSTAASGDADHVQANETDPNAAQSASGTNVQSVAETIVATAKQQSERAEPTLRTEEVLKQSDDEKWDVAPSSVPSNDPLLRCLSILAGLLDRPTSMESLQAGLPVDGDRVTPDLCIRAAEQAGLNAGVVRRSKVQQITPLTMPCILLLANGNACVLTGREKSGEARIILPESGGVSVTSIADLQAQYTGYAIFAQAAAKFDARVENLELIDTKRWFWGTLFKFLPIYKHVFLASILVNLFAIASPLFTMNVYDRVVPNNALETLWVLALGVCIVFVFDFILRNLRAYFVDVAGRNADVIIASKLLQQVMGMRMDQKPASTGSLANNLREFESLREFFSSSTLLAVVDLPFVAVFIGVIYLIGGPVAVIPAIIAPVVLLMGIILQWPLALVVQKTYQESAQKHSLLVEAINGMETIKVAGAEGQIQRQWEKLVGLTANSSGKARAISTLSTTFAQSAVQFATVGVVVYGVFLIAEGEMTVGALIACTILTGRAMAPLGAVAAMFTRFQQSRTALKALDALMKTPVERPASKSFVHRPDISGAIDMRGVTFRYPNAQSNALEMINVKIKPGEKVGVIGRIGSGKSTIGRLIVGLYDPEEGGVMVGDTDVRQLDPADLRRHVGYVAQDNYLFFGSIRENIVFGAPFVDDHAILRAAEIAGVSDFIRGNPMGYDLPVGERGMSLSGGQRQSVSVARSILLDPPILVMDEPTSSMDNSSEAAFRKRLSEITEDKTLVLITHRGSMLALVDRLIIVDAGRVVADGPKADVLEALKRGQVRGAG